MDKIQKKLTRVGDCLVWTGCKNTDGYPKINRNGNANTKGHRYVYEQVKGKIPDNHVIRHTCDNILCLNPDHLVVGTASENMGDRVKRGRTNNHISAEVIVAIREDLKSCKGGYGANVAIARRYGVSASTVCKLRHGKYVLR